MFCSDANLFLQLRSPAMLVLTCIANDFSYDAVFERQVQALAQPGDATAAQAIGLHRPPCPPPPPPPPPPNKKKKKKKRCHHPPPPPPPERPPNDAPPKTPPPPPPPMPRLKPICVPWSKRPRSRSAPTKPGPSSLAWRCSDCCSFRSRPVPWKAPDENSGDLRIDPVAGKRLAIAATPRPTGEVRRGSLIYLRKAALT